MCNKGIECLNKTHNPVVVSQQNPRQALHLMDNTSSLTYSTSGSNLGSHDETTTPRVKLLCSFLGSIMPRPQDGKLRYVGGETRIVSLHRDIGYEELMNKMRELYEGAAVLKYQQPDEDLDALVSVVNDDDVTNMMEEYEKLGYGDGFTRLRIFLFSHPDQDDSSHYVDGDERDSERRYVDALNNLNDGADFRRQQPESPLIGPIEDIHVHEQFFSPLNLESGLQPRSGEMSMPQYNMHHIAIPQRYNEMDGTWSPAIYSPRHHGHHDLRPMPEFPNSPPSRYRMQFGELPDRVMDRVSEEYARQPLSHHSAYDHQPPYSENVVWMPSGAIPPDKAGFPGNLLHGPNVIDGNSACEHCRVPFQRNQLHVEQPNVGNALHQVANPPAECHTHREHFMLNADPKVHHVMYPKDQTDPRPIYNEAHSHERGWNLQHQFTPADEVRTHTSGAGRINEHYIVDGPGINYPPGHANLVDGHHTPSTYSHHRAVHELGNEVFHDQTVAVSHHLHVTPSEERAVRYGNFPYAYGTENLYPTSHGHVHSQNLWRNVQNPVHGNSYETPSAASQVNGTVNPALLRGTIEGGQRIGACMDNQHSRIESTQKTFGFDGAIATEYSYGHPLRLNPNHSGLENKQLFAAENLQPPLPHEMFNSSAITGAPGCNPEISSSNITEVAKVDEKTVLGMEREANYVEKVENLEVSNIPQLEQNMVAHTHSGAAFPESVHSNCSRNTEGIGVDAKIDENDPSAVVADTKLSLDRLSFLPELIASVKKAALEEAEEVKARVKEDAESINHSSVSKGETPNENEAVNVLEENELDSDDNINPNKIEPTKAEAEAIERGLQTIKNDDLEEIRELGSGTYGAVYHGKWKGSDVAIKRIKASCFAGRPSDRERLIADFWKEALILSSLHHPNVVSFYGIVRDGPDGSLATVTEFMVNGSLKQFLQKKDRTIDRRKRLIIAMDAAFGMEYLHGKNIVHFDLKCENLLVNMRDPQRPVCKIGDLGLSKVKQHTLVSGGVRGTLPWMAPELLSGKSHMVTEKIDVYSFGIVMWELLTGEEPYAGMHCASIIGGIVNNSLRPEIPTWCDPEWKALMGSCWASDPAERPSFAEISRKLRSMAAAINVK
ncbi:hypothetical protein JCGZ_23031 [Jatropha curcas]|uniref:Protein kinase domain-containing protein n=1 Tax=Jatropha curcas TaxID=180498 RepID=A0A067L9D0_JATCU|nr:uncharacterized protein LOC105628498 [Jatropha curcas]XP_020532728.1 uncharacterized protein LOC105628498 [Jatropha curcas]KDP43823.1 hypothetical protein JCGZ_23031 [Jatropha curcas]